MKVIACHAIFTTYGFWLPNDPRGSWSNEVWAKHLQRFGDPLKTDSRRSVASRQHDHQLRREAKESLLHEPVVLTGIQAHAVGGGFAQIVRTLSLAVYACVIMPDHVHIVLARHQQTVEQQIGFLKRSATRELNRRQLHPCVNGNTPWARGGWKRFLFNDAEIAAAIDYVIKNPKKCGLPPQKWSFVYSPG